MTRSIVLISTASILSLFAFRGEAFEDLTSYLSKSVDGNIDALVEPPSDEQIRYLENAEKTDFGYVAGGDNTEEIPGAEALKALKGDIRKTVAAYSIRLDPHLSEENYREALERHDLFVKDKADFAGVISTAKVISSTELQKNSSAYLAAEKEALDALRSDPSFLSAFPEPSLSGMQENYLELSLGPMPFGDDDASMLTHIILPEEKDDWGLDNIGAPALWGNPLAQQGKAVGILDMGFALHEDLPLWDPPDNLPVGDHGNHVSGILCAKHNNGQGVRGVLPTCLVVARAPSFSGSTDLYGIKPDSIAAVLNAFRSIVEERDEIKVINVSLGYNWRKRLGVMYLSEEQKQGVSDIASQLIGVYQLAKDRDIFIVSAAGNDSWGLDPKLNAAWASPMSFASIAFCEAQGLCNGIVVEAHDEEDKHADFSNIGGHLSCPGVDVLSTVAYDDKGELATSSYATMSGTSMASPYCAGGLVLLSMVRPSYSVAELVKCAKEAGRKTGDFTSLALDLSLALEQCPNR